MLQTLKRFVSDQHTGTLRAKKTAGCLYWISPMPISQIETALTQHGGAFDGAAGPVRSIASRTCDLLPAVARVATILHPDLDLTERIPRLLVRLELGVPSGAVALARFAGNRLVRGDYQALVKAGLNTPEAIETASDEAILLCVGRDAGKVRVVREAAAAIRTEPPVVSAPIFPDYEG